MIRADVKARTIPKVYVLGCCEDERYDCPNKNVGCATKELPTTIIIQREMLTTVIFDLENCYVFAWNFGK